MQHCQHWEAVSGLSCHLTPSTVYVGYYTVNVVHTHAKTDVVVTDFYDALAWGEATSLVDSIMEANRPGYRHTRLEALQQRLWPEA